MTAKTSIIIRTIFVVLTTLTISREAALHVLLFHDKTNIVSLV